MVVVVQMLHVLMILRQMQLNALARQVIQIPLQVRMSFAQVIFIIEKVVFEI